MWNAKRDVCSTECHSNPCAGAGFACGEASAAYVSWEARQVHRALQSATDRWRGRSDERLMAGSTLSADGTSGTATLPPANRGVQC